MQREIHRPSQAHNEDHHPEVRAVDRVGNLEEGDASPGNQQGGEAEYHRHSTEIEEPRVDHPVDLVRFVPGAVFGHELGD